MFYWRKKREARVIRKNDVNHIRNNYFHSSRTLFERRDFKHIPLLCICVNQITNLNFYRLKWMHIVTLNKKKIMRSWSCMWFKCTISWSHVFRARIRHFLDFEHFKNRINSQQFNGECIRLNEFNHNSENLKTKKNEAHSSFNSSLFGGQCFSWLRIWQET